MKKKIRKPNRPYELPPFVASPEVLVLGLDPGTRNFGIALVGLEKGKVKVYANSVMTNPIHDLTKYGPQRAKFKREIMEWAKLNPTGLVGERFQTRGNGGPTIESVSMMLAITGEIIPKPIKLVVASEWKNKFNRRFADGHEVALLKRIYPELKVEAHQFDAALIGIYGLEKGLGRDLKYTPKDIIRQVEKTSLLDLKARKVPKGTLKRK